MKKYVVVHEHDYGVSTYFVESETEPTVKQVVRCLTLDFEPSKGERLVIDAVDGIEVTVLDHIESDDEEFDEFATDDEGDEYDDSPRSGECAGCGADAGHYRGCPEAPAEEGDPADDEE